MLRPVWAEISGDALINNLNEIKKCLKKETGIMAIVKADAYGHGAEQVSRLLLKNGVCYLGTAVLQEALILRKAGITAPILVLGYIPDEQLNEAIENNITITVYNAETAANISRTAGELDKTAKIHVKIDSGMGRIGFVTTEENLRGVAAVIRNIARLSHLQVEGIFTHFARADEFERSSTLKQLERFVAVVDLLKHYGVYIPLVHAANSAAVISYPQAHFNLVRPGIILYGLYPSHETDREKLQLQPVLQLKARVAHIKEVPAGLPISYGGIYVTEKVCRIATLPLGYADGFPRLLSNKAEVLLAGRRMPVVGRICMDQLLVRVDDDVEINVGDEAVIYGQQGGQQITAEDDADLIGTISYELICAVNKRVPRVYC